MNRLAKDPKHIPDWFPLPTYDCKLTEQQWLDELVFRRTVKTILENTGDKEKAKDIFQKTVLNRTDKETENKSLLLDDIAPLGELWGIREVPPFYISYIFQMMNDTDKGRELNDYSKKLRNGEIPLRELYSKSSNLIHESQIEGLTRWIDWDKEPYSAMDVVPGFPVIVDLEQDDETLKFAFEIWLAGVRSEIGKSPKPISEKDFADWKTFGLLPVFDLLFWAELNDIKYTDALIANVIWPDTFVDNAERLRKVSKPKVSKVFDDWSFVTRFWKQLKLLKALKSVESEKKVE